MRKLRAMTEQTLVEKLRKASGCKFDDEIGTYCLTAKDCGDAADEIERLNEQIAEAGRQGFKITTPTATS